MERGRARQLEHLRRTLRAALRGGAAEVSLAADEAAFVAEELGRLQQSNDRLRRQNKRLRARLANAGQPVDDGALDDGALDAGEGDEGAAGRDDLELDGETVDDVGEGGDEDP